MSKNRIDEIDQKINELKKKKNFEEKRARHLAKNGERKARARRLIETGALAEKYFELDNLNLDEREELFKMFATFINSNKPAKLKK